MHWFNIDMWPRVVTSFQFSTWDMLRNLVPIARKWPVNIVVSITQHSSDDVSIYIVKDLSQIELRFTNQHPESQQRWL